MTEHSAFHSNGKHPDRGWLAWMALACVLFALSVGGVPVASASPGPVAAAPPQHRDDHDRRGKLKVRNHTKHSLEVSYKTEHDDHYIELGHVGKGQTQTFSVQACGQELDLKASMGGHGEPRTKHLEIHCGETSSWEIDDH